jgi:DNA-binding protein HU-beta
MTQNESIRAVAEALDTTPKAVKEMFATLAEVAEKTVKKMDTLVLPGIGKLVAKKRPARTGRNPATGEAIKIPAKKVVKFTVARALKNAANTK